MLRADWLRPRLPEGSVRIGMDASSETGKVALIAWSRLTENSATAVASETPGFIRPMIWTHHKPLFVSGESMFLGRRTGCMLNGTKTSGELCTLAAPEKPGGFTPMMVIGVRFSWMVFPTTDGERPKARAQYPSLI